MVKVKYIEEAGVSVCRPVEKGADREPLLMDVKVIKEIAYFRNLKEGETIYV